MKPNIEYRLFYFISSLSSQPTGCILFIATLVSEYTDHRVNSCSCVLDLPLFYNGHFCPRSVALNPITLQSTMATLKSASRSQTKETELVTSVLHQVLNNTDFLASIRRCVEEAVESRISPLIAQIQDLERTVEAQNDRFLLYDDKFLTMATSIRSLEDANNEMEQYSRRNCLRITGLKETADENTDDLIIKLSYDKLEVQISPSDIDRSHRIGPKIAGRTRSLIVKFATYRSRAMVIKQRRKLKDSGIVIREDLTKRNRELLKATNDHNLTSSAWTLDGKVFAIITKTGRKQRINGLQDLAKL